MKIKHPNSAVACANKYKKSHTGHPFGCRYGTFIAASYKLSKTKLLVELIDLTLQARSLLLTSVE